MPCEPYVLHALSVPPVLQTLLYLDSEVLRGAAAACGVERGIVGQLAFFALVIENLDQGTAAALKQAHERGELGEVWLQWLAPGQRVEDGQMAMRVVVVVARRVGATVLTWWG